MLHQKDGALQKYSLHGLSQIDVFDNTALPEDAHLMMVVYICICSHLSLMENSQQSGNCENRQIQLQQDKPFKSKAHLVEQVRTVSEFSNGIDEK